MALKLGIGELNRIKQAETKEFYRELHAGAAKMEADEDLQILAKATNVAEDAAQLAAQQARVGGWTPAPSIPAATIKDGFDG